MYPCRVNSTLHDEKTFCVTTGQASVGLVLFTSSLTLTFSLCHENLHNFCELPTVFWLAGLVNLQNTVLVTFTNMSSV